MGADARESKQAKRAKGERQSTEHEHRGHSVVFHATRLATGLASIVYSARAFRSLHANREPASAVKPLHDDPGLPVTLAREARAASAGRGTLSAANGKAQAAGKPVASGAMAMAKEFVARYGQVDGATRAAALAFFGILSIVPVLLFVLAALGFFIHDPQQAAGYVQKLITQMLPGAAASQAASDVIAQTHITSAAAGLIKGRAWSMVLGIVSLLWTAISLFVSASQPMNVAWEVKETRRFVKLRMVCLAVFAGAGLLFVLSFLPSAGPAAIAHLHIPGLGLPKNVPVWLSLLFVLVAWAIDISMFVLIYRYLPAVKVTLKAALFGGAVTGILWELFKKGFALYLAHFGSFNKLYGALGGVVLLVTWIYYSCMLLIAGAILCKMYHEHTEEGGVTKKATQK